MCRIQRGRDVCKSGKCALIHGIIVARCCHVAQDPSSGLSLCLLLLGTLARGEYGVSSREEVTFLLVSHRQGNNWSPRRRSFSDQVVEGEVSNYLFTRVPCLTILFPSHKSGYNWSMWQRDYVVQVGKVRFSMILIRDGYLTFYSVGYEPSNHRTTCRGP